MKNNYIFEYLDENDFRKKERSVRKYNMLAYKKLTFTYYPELRSGKFLGKEVNKNDQDKTKYAAEYKICSSFKHQQAYTMNAVLSLYSKTLPKHLKNKQKKTCKTSLKSPRSLDKTGVLSK